ncbi:MAG TPA: RsmE family RNA methyltransferase, partial [Steroidobacteraceae bacterium]|nr:RsmE family RNA methyltransferase [Steroidobacteraceae bacterium]
LGLGDALRALPSGGTRCLLAADATTSLAARVRATGGPIALLIGPEGGLADGERQAAMANQFIACGLGPRILRTETAGLAALAAIQALAGDLSS